MNEQVTGAILTVFMTILLVCNIIGEVAGNYSYSKNFESSWNLAEKASTIQQKSTYIDAFIQKLEAGGFQGEYNALFLETPNNSFDENLKALKSLQGRLHEIQTMDPTSFQYNTAIQQITAQEQGEAKPMMDVFEGIWWKENHFFLWSWVGGSNYLLVVFLWFVGLFLWAEGDNW